MSWIVQMHWREATKFYIKGFRFNILSKTIYLNFLKKIWNTVLTPLKIILTRSTRRQIWFNFFWKLLERESQTATFALITKKFGSMTRLSWIHQWSIEFLNLPRKRLKEAQAEKQWMVMFTNFISVTRQMAELKPFPKASWID